MSSAFDDPLFDPHAGGWRERLSAVVEAVREMSLQEDPQEMLRAYRARLQPLIPMDRTVSLSRRGLEAPRYRITRSDLWEETVNPWTETEKLPVLAGGLLGELLYADLPRVIDDLTGKIQADDPMAEHLAGMRSMAAIPHFDGGAGLNMVVHMRREPAAFSREHFPELVLLSNLFGRATNHLVLAQQLRESQRALRDQYHAVAEMSDTILEQAIGLKQYSKTLENRVQERTRELHDAHQQLREANLDAIYMLAVASEAKDLDTGRHVRRIRTLARLIGLEMGLPDPDADALGHAAVLHDVGKMHVPDHILKKPGPLTPDERLAMQMHTIVGERILADKHFFAPARRVARSHHENWDGSGYPDRLAGAAIPLEARIVHLADVYDALSNPRVYKAAWTPKDAAGVINESEGRMFDPEVARAFRSLFARGAVNDGGHAIVEHPVADRVSADPARIMVPAGVE